MKLFSGTASTKLAAEVARQLKTRLGAAEVGLFPNHETRVELKEEVQSEDIFILQSTSPPVNDNLMELLLMSDALRRCGAKSVTAVVPYLGYSKQDKRKNMEPISARVVADMVQAAGVSRLVTVDIHSPQLEGFFSIPIVQLSAVDIFAKQLSKLKNPVVVSPDIGGVARARKLAALLRCDVAIIEKQRPTYLKALAAHLVGDIKGKDAVMIDDFIDTGGSIVEASKLLKDAKTITVCFTHPLLTDPAAERLSKLDAELITTDTIDIAAAKQKALQRLRVVSMAGAIADSIKAISKSK